MIKFVIGGIVSIGIIMVLMYGLFVLDNFKKPFGKKYYKKLR